MLFLSQSLHGSNFMSPRTIPAPLLYPVSYPDLLTNHSSDAGPYYQTSLGRACAYLSHFEIFHQKAALFPSNSPRRRISTLTGWRGLLLSEIQPGRRLIDSTIHLSAAKTLFGRSDDEAGRKGISRHFPTPEGSKPLQITGPNLYPSPLYSTLWPFGGKGKGKETK